MSEKKQINFKPNWQHITNEYLYIDRKTIKKFKIHFLTFPFGVGANQVGISIATQSEEIDFAQFIKAIEGSLLWCLILVSI
jgi:hypothetical protein